MVVCSSLRNRKPENVIPMLTVKWAHMWALSARTVLNCIRISWLCWGSCWWDWLYGFKIYFLCFGAASGEPSTQQIEIYKEIGLGEEIWSLGKLGIQSEFWKLTPAPWTCGPVSPCSFTYRTPFDICMTPFFLNSDHVDYTFVQPQARLLSSWEWHEDILPSV